ncbi:hypothetical protein QF049_001444 [Paenibacillus sp. W4I10]|nr:hypothetical protein [Paenibacillus sp. W4I10]
MSQVTIYTFVLAVPEHGIQRKGNSDLIAIRSGEV